MLNFLKIIDTAGEHLQRIFSTFYGWTTALFLFIGHFFAPAFYPFIVVGVLVLIDLCWGVAVALKKGNFFLSEALRDTCIKVSIYATSMGSIYMIELLFYQGIAATSIIAAIAGTCEVWSFSASMLIIKPDFPFISLFRRQRRGEIEKKLGTNINDVLQ